MKNALIIIAHGSRSSTANQEIKSLVSAIEQMQQTQQANYTFYRHAFLEASQPNLSQACEELITQQTQAIDIYPLFLALGEHAGKDIPALVAELIEQHPHCQIRLLDYLGHSQVLVATVSQHIDEQIHSTQDQDK